jgi:hypothetical protein
MAGLIQVTERTGTQFRITSDNAGPLDCVVVPGGAGAAGIPSRILFVDAGNAASTSQNGSFSDPFGTIQQAVTAADASGLNSAVIMIAPGTYAENVVVPNSATLGDLVVQGWCNVVPALWMPTDLPGIAGNWTLTGDVSSSMQVSFSNLYFSASLITSGGGGGNDMRVSFDHCSITPAIEGNNVVVEFADCQVLSTDIVGAASLIIRTDGASWSTMVRNNVSIIPASYTREFRDTGADTWPDALNVAGLAIGNFQTVSFDMPTARAGEFCIATKLAPFATDFDLVFSHTDSGHAFFVLTNLGRVSTNFNDGVRVVCFHSDMAEGPLP